MAGQFILFLGEWRRSWLPAELVAGGDSCGETFAGGFGAPGVPGVDKAVGDLPEQFSVFGGVELFVQGPEPYATAVEGGEQAGQVFQGPADVDEAAHYEGAAGRQGGERAVELGPVGAYGDLLVAADGDAADSGELGPDRGGVVAGGMSARLCGVFGVQGFCGRRCGRPAGRRGL